MGDATGLLGGGGDPASAAASGPSIPPRGMCARRGGCRPRSRTSGRSRRATGCWWPAAATRTGGVHRELLAVRASARTPSAPRRGASTSTPPRARGCWRRRCAATSRASTCPTRSPTPSTSSISARPGSSTTSPSAAQPQHVTPSWDLRTLWVTNDTGNSLTPIDPRTGRHGRPVPGRRPLQPVLHRRWAPRDRRRRGASRARLPRAPHDAPASRRCTRRRAPASTTWTTPRTGASRWSPASSPGGWWWSTCAASASSRASICARAPCPRTSSSRPTGARSTSPTWPPTACG